LRSTVVKVAVEMLESVALVLASMISLVKNGGSFAGSRRTIAR
jgi:hypothetical protein